MLIPAWKLLVGFKVGVSIYIKEDGWFSSSGGWQLKTGTSPKEPRGGAGDLGMAKGTKGLMDSGCDAGQLPAWIWAWYEVHSVLLFAEGGKEILRALLLNCPLSRCLPPSCCSNCPDALGQHVLSPLRHYLGLLRGAMSSSSV